MSCILGLLIMYMGDIKNQKLPALNQVQRDLAIALSGKRAFLMGHLKTVLVAPCDEQSTIPLLVTPGLDF